MKRCPGCRRDYFDDTLLYCLDDGTALVEGPASGSGVGDEAATAILSDPKAVETGSRLSESPTVNLRTPTTAAGSEPSKRKLWTVGAIALVLVISGIGFAVYKVWNRAPEKPLQAMRIERLSTNGKSTAAAISPD